jgi:TerC family integral membrane protein
MAAAVALSAARGDSRPALVKKGTGPSGVLNPLDEWHSVPLGGGMGLLHAGRDRRRRELASLEQQTPLLVAAESKGGNAMQQRQAIMATIWSFVATAAFAFGFVLPYKGKKATLDFITGFLVEKSLSVDNLFVFLMLFEYFRVPDEYTERVLRWGIMSALVLRGVMIAIGVAAVQRFRPVLLGFALILIVSAYKMLQPEGDEESLQDNAVMKIARWCVKATDEYDGDKFFTKIDGVRRATPMFVVLICIELSDVLFAVDSIPAVVGITQDAFIVYSSNIFALMALRSLYLILSKSVQQLIYLRHAVATILGFVGLKMVLEFFHVHVSSVASLGVIIALLAAGTIASLHKNRQAATSGVKVLLKDSQDATKSVNAV